MPRLLSEAERTELLSYLEARYGFKPSLFDEYFFERSKRDIWMIANGAKSIHTYEWELEKIGLRAFNGERFPPKPTTAFIQRFGLACTLSRIELSSEQLQNFMRGQVCEQVAIGITQGYAFAFYRGRPFGCGFVRDGNFESQFPQKIGRSIAQKYF